MPSQLAFILHSPFQNVIIRQLWKSVFLACSFTLFFTTDFPIHIFSHIHCTALLTSSFSFFFWFYLLLVLQYLSKKKKNLSLVLQHFLLLMLSCKNVNLWLFVLSLLSCLFIIYLMSLFCALCHRYVWHASSFICPAYCWWLCIGWFNLGLWLKWLRAGVDFRFKYYQ